MYEVFVSEREQILILEELYKAQRDREEAVRERASTHPFESASEYPSSSDRQTKPSVLILLKLSSKRWFF